MRDNQVNNVLENLPKAPDTTRTPIRSSGKACTSRGQCLGLFPRFPTIGSVALLTETVAEGGGGAGAVENRCRGGARASV